MNSLFIKLLVWLVLVGIVTSAGAVLVIVWSTPAALRESPWPSRLVQFYADEAKRAYDRGGQQELADYLWRLNSTTNMQGHLLDPKGIDLVSGIDRAEILTRLQSSHFRIQSSAAGKLLAGRPTWDNRAVFLIYPPTQMSAFPLLLRHHVWVFVIVIALSYFLARHLTNPLRRVQAAAERLGEGDLSARAPVERGDEVGRLAAAFNQMAERLQRLVQSQQQLLLDVSHEIRSPLARLGVAVELARSSTNPAQELDIIEQQSERLNTLVGSLLQISRAQAQPGPQKLDEFPIRDLIEEIVAGCRLEAAALECSIQLQATSNMEVPMDRELLARAVENVLRNAIRYSPKNETVTVRLEVQPETVTITIRDHGPGVPQHSLPKLFDAFYRVEGQAPGGVGLGLSIARRAMEFHKGQITAQNANPGLEVVLTLPRAR